MTNTDSKAHIATINTLGDESSNWYSLLITANKNISQANIEVLAEISIIQYMLDDINNYTLEEFLTKFVTQEGNVVDGDLAFTVDSVEILNESEQSAALLLERFFANVSDTAFQFLYQMVVNFVDSGEQLDKAVLELAQEFKPSLYNLISLFTSMAQQEKPYCAEWLYS